MRKHLVLVLVLVVSFCGVAIAGDNNTATAPAALAAAPAAQVTTPPTAPGTTPAAPAAAPAAPAAQVAATSPAAPATTASTAASAEPAKAASSAKSDAVTQSQQTGAVSQETGPVTQNVTVNLNTGNNSAVGSTVGGGEKKSPATAAAKKPVKPAAVAPAPAPAALLPAPKACDGCVEREGVWKGSPAAGTVTASIKDGFYGHFQIVYDATKKCPAVQQWRPDQNSQSGEKKKLWFKDKTMADQWLARGMTGEQLEAKLAGATFKPASVGYQKWIDLGL